MDNSKINRTGASKRRKTTTNVNNRTSTTIERISEESISSKSENRKIRNNNPNKNDETEELVENVAAVKEQKKNKRKKNTWKWNGTAIKLEIFNKKRIDGLIWNRIIEHVQQSNKYYSSQQYLNFRKNGREVKNKIKIY